MAIHLTADDIKDLRRFNKDARMSLRRGSIPSHRDFDCAVEPVRRLCGRPISEYADTVPAGDNIQKLVLEALRRGADLADRMGDTDLAHSLMGQHVLWALQEIKCYSDEADGAQADRLAELIWYVVVYSVIEHRFGTVDQAVLYVKHAQAGLDQLPSDGYKELRHRVAFALGRHYQSFGTEQALKDSERHYTLALDYCAQIAHRDRSYGEDTVSDKDYASYRTGITLIGLSRICLDRGELTRAFRQLCTARMFVSYTADTLTTSYVDFLSGSILRQQPSSLAARSRDKSRGLLHEAIELLERACAVFEAKDHRRFYFQCRHEHAKALLTAGHFGEALVVLRKSPKKTGPVNNTERRPRGTQWEGNDRILEAQILFQQERLTASDAKRARVDQVLIDANDSIEAVINHLEKNQVRAIDVIARGRIIQAEIDLELGMPENVGPHLLECVAAHQQKPIDSIDVGWGWLVIAEARLRLGRLDDALAAMNKYERLPTPVEHEAFASRARQLKIDIELAAANDGLWFKPFPKIPDRLTPDDVFKMLLKLELQNYHCRLSTWLLDQLGKAGVAKNKQAILLGVTPNTLPGKNWADCGGDAARRKDSPKGPNS